MEKVHEFPRKETSLTNGNLISFGTGNATYRFSFVPLIIWVYSLEPNQTNQPLKDKLSSIGMILEKNSWHPILILKRLLVTRVSTRTRRRNIYCLTMNLVFYFICNFYYRVNDSFLSY